MSERNYLLPLIAIAIGVVFLGVLVTGIVVWNRMPVMVSAPPSTTTPPVVAPPPPPTPALADPDPTAHRRNAADDESTPPLVNPHRNVPPADVTLSAPTTTISNAESSIARLRPGFRSCYNRGLATDPSLHGAITITIVVDASGDVTNVTKKSGGLNAEVDACIIRRARGATFDRTPSGATLDVPVRFERVN